MTAHRGRLVLPGHHGAVAGVGLEQLAVGAGRHDPAAAQEGHLVDRVEHQRAGADHDRGPARAVAAQPRRDPGLGVRVDRGGRLDQHQDLGVAGQRAGQHQPLPLAAGERPAALGDHGVEAVGQRLEDVVGRGGLEGARHVARRLLSQHGGEPAREQGGAGVGDHDPAAYVGAAQPVSGTPPRVTSSSTSGAQSPSRSASAAASSGWSLTTAVTSPGRTRSPVRASASSAPGGRRLAGSAGSRWSGVSASTLHDPAGRDPGADQLVGVLGRGPQRDHQERRVAVERDQLAGADPALDGGPRAEPDHEHHEDARAGTPGARPAPTAAEPPATPAWRVACDSRR